MDAMIGALLGVAFGWGLTEVGHWFRGRRDDRRAIGRAIAHVLEIERQHVVLQALTRSTLASLSDEQRQGVQDGVAEALKGVAALQTRFEETVDVVAGIDPLLGAELRARGSFPVQSILAELSGAQLPPAQLQALKPLIADALAATTRLVKTLAWAHGVRTWWRITHRAQHDADPLHALASVLRPK